MKNLIGKWAHPAIIAPNNFVNKSLSNWSLNPAVGCNHGCGFCVSGETKIQMEDGTTKLMRDVQIGEKILTVAETDNAEWSKRFVVAEVIAKVKSFKPAIRVVTDDAEVICSDDHRWLTTRGWKYTTGTESGKKRRAHLTAKSEIYSIGSSSPAPDFTEEYRLGYLSGLIRGDGSLNRYDYSGKYAHRQKTDVQHQFRLVMKDSEPLNRARLWLAEFGIELTEFVFKCSGQYEGTNYPALRTSKRSHFEKIKQLIEIRESDDWLRGWIAGILDAEGSDQSRISNKKETILKVTEKALNRFGFKTVREKYKKNDVQNVRFKGGVTERIRLFQICSPACVRKMGAVGQAIRRTAKVRSVTELHSSIEMFDVMTTSETFLANGLVAHNCYVPKVSTKKLMGNSAALGPLAKLGVMDADEQWGDYVFVREWNEQAFMSSLRKAENEPRSNLKPDGNRAVMFCSTTDAYQVLPDREMNQRLETVVIKSLERIRDESTLNVRILTRGPLARRDFDLMKSFGPRLTFGMSLPTLNDKLARVYEQSAPAPSRRLETLQRAKDAGLHVFVAIAPTYPECDADDLRRTIQAVADLEPITIFHEPINERAGNIERMRILAKEADVSLLPFDVFADAQTQANYQLKQLFAVEKIAAERGVLPRLHLWPDKSLQKWASKEFLDRYWNRISEWPRLN